MTVESIKQSKSNGFPAVLFWLPETMGDQNVLSTRVETEQHPRPVKDGLQGHKVAITVFDLHRLKM